ncbi:MAG: glutamate--tRNA ligase [Candidatus Dadabacteria bacterium]|nr:MAG: glutamate--tRNA ligase [Candidatus Dadabacteria bacterium]TDI99434.1 MAG: glutamate--tRNA ligase [Candidatus Dadabacteria bacterium]
MTVRTRFAPSPTGSLHIGGARTAIFNWLFARHAGGEFILRIEDTDRTRSTEESIQEITQAMEWLGLDWDEGPFRQSDRLDIYQKLANELLESGKAYKCYVTPEELGEKRKEAQNTGEVLRYKREWAKVNEGVDNPYAIRLQTPDEGTIEVQDLLRGTVTFDAKEVDDFVILKRDGFPTYNFAVVVDDATMKITHVIRGDDHLINTPRQVLIYNALSYEIPKIAHVSMILGSDNKRLSKRHGATSVVAYKDRGYLPEAIINFLSRLGWSYGDQEIFSKTELIEKFTLDNVGKSAAVFNEEKLDWLNGWYIRNKPPQEIAQLVIPILKEKGLEVELDEKLIKIIKELSQRAKTLLDITNTINYFYTEEIEYEEKAKNKFLKAENKPVLQDLVDKLSNLSNFNMDETHKVFDRVMEERELKLGKIAQPVRVALTGGTVSPGIFEVMDILGKDEVLKRLNAAIYVIPNEESSN